MSSEFSKRTTPDPPSQPETSGGTLADFFAASPLRESGLEIERPQEGPRELSTIDLAELDTDRVFRELRETMARLEDKIGSSTDGLALPSMTEVLFRDFNMSTTTPRMRCFNDGKSLEVGVVAWSRAPTGDAMIVHVVRRLGEDDLDRFLKKLRNFRDLATDYAQRKVYGILAAVDIPDELREKVLCEGIYLARIHDDQFELQVPEGFQARAF